MASAEVLQNSAAASSRKQGHLEAGKRRLEEFRKKKAEGKSKKAASTGQLLSPEVNHYEKFSQDHDRLSDRVAHKGDDYTRVEFSRVGTNENSSAVSSQGTAGDQSRVAEAVTVNNESTSHIQYISTELSQVEDSELYNNSERSMFIDGYYSQGKERNDLRSNREPGKKLSDQAAIGQQNELPIYANTMFEGENNYSSVYSVGAQSQGQKSSSDKYTKDQGRSDIFLSKPIYLPDGFRQHMGLPSSTPSDEYTSTLSEDTTGVEQHRHDVKNHDTFELDISRNKTIDSISHHLDFDSEPWHPSQSSSANSSAAFKSSSNQHSFSSTISGPGTWRTRPPFLDFQDVPRPSSISHSPFSELMKANPHGSLNSSIVHTAEVHPLAQKPVGGDFQRSTTLVNPNSLSSKESNLNLFNSVSEGKQFIEDVRDGDRKEMWDFPASTKDEDFAALEQHIEDLTHEKFSLQRALESSRTLAESLAAENSSLTESFNQQGKVVNQLKSDMDQLQVEIRAQLMALESVKMEYANAQLECSAADERAKILASEIIGLEEKALKLRSNELKLEKQLENSSSEISSYKKKLSSFEIERQDFQSTIEALQEEKKLMQAKLRKASSSGKAFNSGQASAAKKDATTSTEDLGIERSNQVDRENAEEMLSSSALNTGKELGSPAFFPSNVHISNFQSETRSLFYPDTSSVIPHDQLRIIDNINSLMSELTLEKEELMQELRVQSTNNSKLKDLNIELSQKLEKQTQRLELLTAQHMVNENTPARSVHIQSTHDPTAYADEGDEVVERVLSWIMKLFPGGPTKRRTSKLL